jgi:hypothetical protein
MRRIGLSRAELSLCRIMLGEGRGLGQFGKGRYRRWYKRRLNKALRRVGRRMAQER